MLAYPSKYVHVRYLYRGLMSYSKARIRDVEDLNPRFRRLVFDVDDLGRLSLPGVADEAVGLYVPSAGEHDVPDMICRDGVWAFHDIDVAPQGRNYSIRHLDAATGSVVIDVVIHSNGPVTEFAQRARPGDRVTMSHARGWYRPPPETDWQILVADLAGLPALARILTESDDDASLIVVTEVGDPSDVGLLPEFAGTHLADVGGNGYTPSSLAARMRDLDLPPDAAIAGLPARPPNPARCGNMCVANSVGAETITTSSVIGDTTASGGPGSSRNAVTDCSTSTGGR